MRPFSQALTLVVALGVQVALWPSLAHRSLPAVVLVVAVSWGYASRLSVGFYLAFWGGLLIDLYSQTHLGMFTAATVLGYASTLLLRPPAEEATLGLRFSGIFLAAIIYHLVLLFWLAVTTKAFPFWEMLGRTATLDVVATLAVFLVVETLLATLTRKPTSHARSI